MSSREKGLELKPCPFCGGAARVKDDVKCYGHGDYDKSAYVTCCYCHATGEKFYKRYCKGDLEETAVAAWNRRTTDE